MTKKTILIITSEFPPQPGGIGNHAYYLALYLAKNQYAVSVIADQRDVANAKELAFDAALPFAVQRISLKTPRFLMYFSRISKTLQGFKKADYVIATGKFSLWNVAFCSLFYKRNKMAVIHGSEVNFKTAPLKRSIDFSLRRFETIVAVSNYTKHLVSHLKRQVVVIPNGIDLQKWKNESIEKITLKGQPVLTTVGRVSTRKGQMEVIKLLPEILKIHPKAQYHCIGIPTEAAVFLKQAKILGVSNHVSFHGAVSEANLKAMLLASDVFVMLSTESNTGDVEGFGIAILEANALGIPAIGSKGCGIEDAILDGESGGLVTGNDSVAFQKALQSILDDTDKYQNAAKKWANIHAWETIIKQYLALIEKKA